MFYGISHIDLQVIDLATSRHFWSTVIGFAVNKEGEGFVELESGNIVIRLIEVPTIEKTSTLRLSVSTVKEAYERLLEHGAISRYEPMHTADLEKIACVNDSNGHSIIIWRTLSEDEWGYVPELPKTGEWLIESEELVKRLLSHVPAFFRMLARRKVTRVIEGLAKDDNSAVTREHVIKGYITSSAKATRERLIKPLQAEGIKLDDYKAEFDYE